MPLSPEISSILVCPKCKGTLEQVGQPEGFGCKSCRLLYRNEDGIPNFIIDEASPWTDHCQQS